jgi:hypothetical protein
MLKTANGSVGVFMAGQEYDFHLLGLPELGKQFADAGAAVQVEERAVAPAGESPESPAIPPADIEEAPEPKPKARPRKRRAKKVSGE